SVFRVTLAGTMTTLASFTLQTGAQPVGGLVEGPDGDFYGTTTFAGASTGGGSIFRLTPAGSLAIVHFFNTSPNTNGFNPVGLLLASDGNFYGTTKYGTGTLFRLTPSGEVTTLFRFPSSWLPDSIP